MNILVEVVGWTGAAALLLAFVLVSNGKLQSRSATYQILNIVGSFGFIVNGWYHGAFPSVLLNVIWLILAVAFLVRLQGSRETGR